MPICIGDPSGDLSRSSSRTLVYVPVATSTLYKLPYSESAQRTLLASQVVIPLSKPHSLIFVTSLGFGDDSFRSKRWTSYVPGTVPSPSLYTPVPTANTSGVTSVTPERLVSGAGKVAMLKPLPDLGSTSQSSGTSRRVMRMLPDGRIAMFSSQEHTFVNWKTTRVGFVVAIGSDCRIAVAGLAVEKVGTERHESSGKLLQSEAR